MELSIQIPDSRIKVNVTGAVNRWWLRSAHSNNENLFWYIPTEGTNGVIGGDTKLGVAFGFCI